MKAQSFPFAEEIPSQVDPSGIPTYPARPVNGGPMKADTARPGWCYEPKYNGWRALVHTSSGAMFNRRGGRLSIEHEFAAVLAELRGCAAPWLDCEALDRRHGLGRGSLIVLDIPGAASLVSPETYNERQAWLRAHFGTLPIDCRPEPCSVYCAPNFNSERAHGVYESLRRFNQAWKCPFYEGVVGKKESSAYPVQLRSPDLEFAFWQKHRWPF